MVGTGVVIVTFVTLPAREADFNVQPPKFPVLYRVTTSLFVRFGQEIAWPVAQVKIAADSKIEFLFIKYFIL
ncbi:MAG: hypothetical protein IBJ00_00600 [Alphaproteobacteria bacterium]|nr:hypothetical protein [Alphaproteobacteria bacterium]